MALLFVDYLLVVYHVVFSDIGWGSWRSDDAWSFETNYNYKDDLIYIKNLSKGKFLGTTVNGNVRELFQVGDEDKQLWKKGVPDADGYFTLENAKVPKVLGFFLSGLKIKGNITLIWKPSYSKVP